MAPRPPKDDPDQPLLDLIPERFDADADSREAKRGAQGRLFLSIALGLAAIVATVVTIWYIFANQPAGTGKDGVPVVAAEQGPIKTKPVEPGGMEVPNQDKLVYERMAREQPQQPERLLPPPEQPMAPPPVASQPTTLATPKPRIEALSPVEPPPSRPAEPPPAVAAEPPAKVVAEPMPAPAAAPAAPAPAAPPPPEQKVAAAPPPPPAPAAKAPAATPAAPAPPPAAAPAPPPAAAKPIKAGAWLIQIAALRDQETAQKEWSRIQAANKDLLGGLSSDIIRADLGARGVFWRVRGGPLDEAAARRLCDELGKRKIGCMVVRK